MLTEWFISKTYEYDDARYMNKLSSVHSMCWEEHM